MKRMVIDEYGAFLTECLRRGTIRIGSGPEKLFHAFFVSHEKQTVEVHSDRGFDHLLLILVSSVLKMKGIYDDAESLYVYSLGVSGENEFERLLMKGTMTMVLIKESIHMYYDRSTSFDLHEMPGTYRRHGSGSTVLDAMYSVLAADDIPVSCVPDVPPLI